jgi:CubicO group peptidase (beta-lactamase class C family)
LKYINILIAFHISWLVLISCSDSSIESPKDNGTQFPAKGNYAGVYWPTEEWRTCEPEQVGMDSELLMTAYDYATKTDFETQAILVVKDGYIIGEAYLNGTTINSQFQGYSFAKSFTNAVMGIAIDKGYINSIDDFVYEYLPEWNYAKTDSMKKRVKIKHLLSMTGGLDWNYDSLIVDDYIMLNNENYVKYVLMKDIIYEPGTHWNYSNGEAILISGVMENAINMHVHTFAGQYLFNKIGLTQISWSTDPSGQTNTAFGIWASIKEYAKLGYLYLNKGRWNGQTIISEDWINLSIAQISEKFNHYGFYWWTLPGFENYDQYNIPDSAYFAIGANGQRMCIVPEKDLIVLRMADDRNAEENTWDTLKFLSLILESIIE